MRIIGIDPGTIKMGFGVIETNSDILNTVVYGVISVAARKPIEAKLLHIYNELKTVLDTYNPDAVALEEPFVSENVRSAMSIGRAQAIAFLAASERSLPVYRYSPSQVKLQATNYGGSTKSQVNEIVKLQLGIREKTIPDDAADALAVAICHINQCHINKLTGKNG
jgi:crossover junction endodeoxyribonuclease RuvC